MKKCALLMLAMGSLGFYIYKYQPQVKNQIMKPFKKMMNKINI